MNQDTPQDDPFTAPTRRRGCRRVLKIGGTVMLLVCGVILYRVCWFIVPVSLEIGPETTVIDRPLLPDGRVDYIAALNEQLGEGITPENNAAVPLMQAFGPESIDAEQRVGFFRSLGIEKPTADGDYVIDWVAWLRRDAPADEFVSYFEKSELEQQLAPAKQRPWSGEEFPEVAEWLAANEAPLELIVTASTRPRFQMPLVNQGEPPLVHALRSHSEVREAATLLIVRSMRRLGDGDVEGAWDDMLACHRLSRLVARGVTSLNVLVGLGVTAMAVRGCAAIAGDDRLTSEQALRFAADLEALPPVTEFSTTVDLGERYMALDAIQALAVGIGGGRRLKYFAGRGLDWSQMMQITNDCYDQVVEGFRKDTFRARNESLQLIDTELESDLAETSESELITTVLIGSRHELSRKVTYLVFNAVFPAIVQLHVAETRTDARLRLLRAALMLGAYRADHGEYPDALDQLSLDYLVEIPLDPFPDEPFRYERTEEGYRLYSIGENLTDDGGLTFDSDPEGDDLIIQFPAPPESLPGDDTAVELLADADLWQNDDSDGRSWHVSPDGDDEAAGSESEPLKTLAAALHRAQSGDRIELAPGTYEGDVQTEREGVTITGPKEAVIHGPENKRGIEIRHDGTVLRGFTIERVDIAVWIFGADECVIEDLMVRDIGGEGLRIKNGSSNNIVRGCWFVRMGLEGFNVAAGRKNGEGVYIGTAPEQRSRNDPPNVPDRCTGNLIEDCTFDTEAAEAVDIKEDSEENIIRKCYAEDSRDPDGGVFDSRGDRNQFIECIALGGRGHGFRFGGDTVKAGEFGQEEDRTYGKNNVMRNCHAEYSARWGAAPMVAPQDIDDSNTWLRNTDGEVRPYRE